MKELGTFVGVLEPRDCEHPGNEGCVVQRKNRQNRQIPLLILFLGVQDPTGKFTIHKTHDQQLNHPEPISHVFDNIVRKERPMEHETEAFQEGTVEDGELVKALDIVVVVLGDFTQTQQPSEGRDETESYVARAEV